MLSEIEPSAEITGGIWYSESEFNTKLIDVLCEKCVEYIERQGTASRKEITLYVRTLGLFPSDIKEEDMQSILSTLYFDDKIEIAKAAAPGTESLSTPGKQSTVSNSVFKVKKKYVPDMAMLNVPCTYCPVMKECNPDGIISPSTCAYFKDWLGENKI